MKLPYDYTLFKVNKLIPISFNINMGNLKFSLQNLV